MADCSEFASLGSYCEGCLRKVADFSGPFRFRIDSVVLSLKLCLARLVDASVFYHGCAKELATKLRTIF